MSMNDETTERKIFAQGEKYKIFTTEQDSGNWMATILYEKNGAVETHSVTGPSRSEAHKEAFKWVKTNVTGDEK